MRIRSTLAASLVAVGSVIVAAPAASAATTGYYSVPYSSTLYYHSHDAGVVAEASYTQWAADVFPAAMPARTEI
jgi:predicted GNAT superfamily acetyltransferase